MSDEGRQILAPAMYSDEKLGPEYRQQLAVQWAQQDALGGIAGMVEYGNEEHGHATLAGPRHEKPSGNNTRCAICGQMFDGCSGRRTICADERRHAELAATKG